MERRGEWSQVLPRKGKRKPPPPSSPSQLSLYNRCEVLELDGQPTEDGNEDPPGESSTTYLSAPKLMTSSSKKKRRVIVVGDSVLRGTEGPCVDQTHTIEVCCLPGARVRDIKRKITSLVRPSDYYPLLVIQAGINEVVERSLKSLKKDFTGVVN